MTPQKLSDFTRIAVLVAFGLILFLFESAIPRPLPWLKPGLANLVTLVTLYLYGFRPALLVVTLRVVLAGLLLGSFGNPAFVFALAGGLGATFVMGALVTYGKDVFSVIGVSIAGAFAHNLVQIFLAAQFIVSSTQAFYLLPIMLLSALFSGFLVGLFSHYLLRKITELEIV